MQRDPKSGRFLPGNTIAVGNKGNSESKWGNTNAVKHGFFRSLTYPKIREDGTLVLYKKTSRGFEYVQINQEDFFEDDGIWIRTEIIDQLRKMGFSVGA